MSDFNNSFLSKIHKEIKTRLLAGSQKAREVDGKLNHINCPSCGKPDAFAYANEPNIVMCHRNNQCGVNTLTRDMFPDLFTDFGERFKPTTENPLATAEAFLQARGLDTTQFDFEQGNVTENKKTYLTVKIEFNSVTFQRLIDYKGSNKTRLTKYKGKHFATKSVAEAEKVFVVEGIIDALALEQSGIPAIATLSSGHNPESCFEQGVHYVLAFDNDNAGHKAIKKFKVYLEGQEIEFSVALPPTGKDWNDLLISGDLSLDRKENTLEWCDWRGNLAMATGAVDYFKVYCEKYPYSAAIFEFKGQTYKGTIKDNEEEVIHSVIRLLDCTLNIAYSIEDASLQYESRISHIVSAISTREGLSTLRIRGGDFSALNDFKAKLLQYRLLFFGGGYDLTLLAEYLFKKKPIKVRECQALGYDSTSDCYVFNKFLYDKTGKQYPIDKDGYFHSLRLKPFSSQDKSITKIEPIDVGKFVTDLYNAYGDKGLLALGFWVSTTFSHVIFDEFGFFPFMSFHGDPHCGKSDLTTILNRCFFVDSEGLTMSSGNTKKGELRSISQKSSMVTAMLEGRKGKSRFDYDSILPLYNRNSLQVRAQTTNDNQVYDLKFTGTLAFIQNIEQFVSKPAKERVVSIRFNHDKLDDTYQAWQYLKAYSVEQLAGVGHYILSNREYFERNINKEILDAAQNLRDKGVGVDRVAKNHAVVYAGASILMELAKPNIKDDLLNFTFESAMSKMETSRSELPVADLFMECITDFNTAHGVAVNEGKIIVHIPTVLKTLGSDYGHWDKKSLTEELKLVDTFIERKTSRVFGSGKECWHFRINEKVALQNYK